VVRCVHRGFLMKTSCSALLVLAALGALPLACAAPADSADDPDEDSSEALSDDEKPVGKLFAKPVDSLDAKASGVIDWEVLMIHNTKQNIDYTVAVGWAAAQTGVEPAIEAITRVADGRREYMLRSPDAAKRLEITASQLNAIGRDLERVAQKAAAVANPQSRLACQGLTAAMAVSGLATAILGVATAVVCTAGTAASLGGLAPVCINGAAWTIIVGGLTLTAKGAADRCWETRENAL
jgi:hypothetical protein